jgi:hypothetical protein
MNLLAMKAITNSVVFSQPWTARSFETTPG